ncbi:MAG TPA: nicotinate (nicotinamide) nucleotide adenylyltransferase [Gemmatimonadetes bacterium]|nr:nicotinate (nicotinamide) nucleotide adenylyltransferase [Gemmatimonadota bacterium]
MAHLSAKPDEDRPVRLGVFGGTFDPPHIGHVLLTKELQASTALDEILWIPARVPPHKPVDGPTSPELRLEMACAATKGLDHHDVSNVELQRPGPSYTVDTLRTVRAECPSTVPVLIMGSDQFAELEDWHEAAELVALAEVCVLARDGVDVGAVAPGLDVVWSTADVSAVDVSSSDIRERVREGRPYKHLVPAAVAEIIERESLYIE